MIKPMHVHRYLWLVGLSLSGANVALPVITRGMCTIAGELGRFSKKTEVKMTLIGTKVIINRKYDEITSYVNVGLFQNNGITCIILNLIHLKEYQIFQCWHMDTAITVSLNTEQLAYSDIIMMAYR